MSDGFGPTIESIVLSIRKFFRRIPTEDHHVTDGRAQLLQQRNAQNTEWMRWNAQFRSIADQAAFAAAAAPLPSSSHHMRGMAIDIAVDEDLKDYYKLMADTFAQMWGISHQMFGRSDDGTFVWWEFDEDDILWVWPEERTPRITVEIVIWSDEPNVRVTKAGEERALVVTGDLPVPYTIISDYLDMKKDEIWKDIIDYSIYGFNAHHSVVEWGNVKADPVADLRRFQKQVDEEPYEIRPEPEWTPMDDV